MTLIIRLLKEFKDIIDIKLRGIGDHYEKYKLLLSRVILTLGNRRLRMISNSAGRIIPDQTFNLMSSDKIVNEDENALKYPTKFINSLSTGSIPGHIIVLKRGLTVMILRNMNKKKFQCNGTRYIGEDAS